MANKYFLIPVFNEKENIINLWESFREFNYLDDSIFVFSDDGSTDGSSNEILRLFPSNRTYILGDGKNYGPGHAFNLGFEFILSKSNDLNDYIITLEADNTSDLQILSNMIQISEMGFDLILASVYAQGGSFQKLSFFRYLLSVVANLALRVFLGIRILTLTSFYRIYRLSLISSIKKNYESIIDESGFISMVEILVKAIEANAKIIEYPMELHSNRRNGKSKMKLMKTFFSYLKFLLKIIVLKIKRIK